MLVTEAYIAQIVASGHAVDIVSFNYAKAFDKSPHLAAIKILAGYGVSGISEIALMQIVLKFSQCSDTTSSSRRQLFIYIGCRIKHYAGFG